MRAPLSWLAEYVDLPLAPEALAEELTLRGMEVAGLEVSGAEWTDVVVGRVLELRRHPNADTLWLTRVDVGSGEPLDIVCGAQNLALGQLVPVARAGAVLTGDRRIERSKIRGEVSDGMLCSAAELGLGSDAEGILILGTGDEHGLGTDLRRIFGETVLDVDVKPNRGDVLSMIGLAREIAAFTGGAVRSPDVSVEESTEPTSDHVRVRIDEPALCPRFAARWFDGVANSPSPEWMQRRLVAAGMRPISAIVDVTNYVMHELGQPQHAYDAAAIPNGEIVVRRARDGEVLETLDHARRPLDARMLVIADRERAIGLAGIMGGASTEVGEATTSVILESAVFHGPTIRNAARRLGLRSEASMRHEKGIGGDLPRLAADRAAHLIQHITGARAGRGIVDNDPSPKGQATVRVEIARASRLLGIDLTADRITELLAPLGFETADDGGALRVTVPPHRLDVVGPEDVAEEIARSYGYGRLPGRLPTPVLPPFRPDPSGPRHLVRRIAAGIGLDEVVTHALISADDLRRTGYNSADEHLVRLANPISDLHAIMRPVLYPSLLGALAENLRMRRRDPWIFEVGKTYHHQPSAAARPGAETAGTGRVELWHLGIALLGPRTPRAIGSSGSEADVDDLKGVIEAIHAALGAPPPAYAAEGGDGRHPHLHPGRTGLLVDPAGASYGSVGEVHPDVVAAWGLVGRPVIAAIHLGRLLGLAAASPSVMPVPAAQPIDRDLAVVVSESTPLGDLLRIVRLGAGPMLVEVRPFDAWRGPQVGDGRVSYALGLRFQPARAGDEKAVDKAMSRVTGSLRHHLGAEIR